MAKKPEGRTFNVSVIGLSGTEREKGLVGIGKSCLCNRFIHNVADKYHNEHISVLSQSDFGGRVINNDHFLYWGEVTKTDEGNNFTFHVIEQTEFVDDVSFMPFKTGRTDPYQKRCVATKVQSAEKLMYICKEQLGMETDNAYEQKLMPDGKLSVDGIICCFDVSKVKERTLDKQSEFVLQLLNNAMKTKKPIVLVTTKSDEMDTDHLHEAERLVNRKEFKGSIPLVETSAHENVNVETAFLVLAHLMDKSKARTKIIPFREAMRSRKEIQDVASEAFKNLLKSKLTDYKTSWANAKKKLEKEGDFQHYVDLFGTDQARRLVKNHTVRLREELIRNRETMFLKRLPDVLQYFLQDLETINDRSWTTCQQVMMRHPEFTEFFVEVAEPGMSWKFTEFVDNHEENRLPFDLLTTPEAETCFRNHVNALQAAHRKEELKREFRSLLETNIDIPGTQLADNYTLFIGKECYTGLQENERQLVYEDFQRQLRNRLKIDFQELLWERPSVFRSLNLNQNLTEDDLNVIYNSLNDDQRFRKLYKLEDDRKVMLLNHVVFLDRPSVDRCFFHITNPEQCPCVECHVSLILRRERHLLLPHDADPANRRSYPLSQSSESSGFMRPLNLVLLGKEGLATELYKEIRALCEDDLFRCGSRYYNLDYRPIEGDVMEEQNSLATPTFKPHGCLCVYTSQESLEYVQSSLVKTLESDLARDEGNSLEGLPIVVILAYSPGYTAKELYYLRENGKVLARSFQSEFVDIPAEDLAEKRKFYPEQIEQALTALVRDPSLPIGRQIMEDTEPDLRLLLCMMCGDPFPMDIPLQPFLSDDSCIVTSDPETSSISPEEENVFTIDAVLDYTKQKVEITATSYHGGHLLINRGELYHGFILVYCPKRRASLATLKSFMENIHSAAVLVLAIPEDGVGSLNGPEYFQGLKDGSDLARNMEATFVKNFGLQNGMMVYNKFLKEVWDHHDEVENGLYQDEPSPPPAYDPMYRRPPAPLPNTFPTTKSSTSNSQSTEDMEPLYDQPTVASHSDSERASSPSPPPLPSSSPPPDEQIYCVAIGSNELVKPSMLKARRNQYAEANSESSDSDTFYDNGPLREQYRKSFPAMIGEEHKLRSGMSLSMTEHLDSEPVPQTQYPVRKSRSMKLAVKDEAGAWAINEPSRTTKSSTFPATSGRTSQKDDAWHHDTHNSSAGGEDETIWSPNVMYESAPYTSSHKPQKPKTKPKPLNFAQYAIGGPAKGRVQAPLAMPEPIEIADYSTVKDALYPGMEGDYALVDDALPAGKLHRIKSTSRKKEKGTDSEESEFSSLERDKERGDRKSASDLYSKVNRKPTPHKKKHKNRNADNRPYITHVYRDPVQSDLDRSQISLEHAGRSNSQSEDSGGTGDELQPGREKRRSVKKKTRSPGSVSGPGTFSPHMSDSDILSSPPGQKGFEDDDSCILKEDGSIAKHGSEEGDLDFNESGNWSSWFTKKTGKDTIRAREKKQREAEERRRQKEDMGCGASQANVACATVKTVSYVRLKRPVDDESDSDKNEEEKKQKEQVKLQKKIRKKESKTSGQSEGGVSLNDYPMSPSNPSVPQFIEKCVDFIEEEGLTAEGIYRIPGNKAQVDLLSTKFSEDPNVDIASLEIQVNAVATVLKAFFQDLTEPLVPVSLYDELIEASGVVDKSSRILALRGVFLKMHPLNFEVLKFLVTHLHKVSQNNDQNSMDSKNLARCWWPTLIRMQFDTFEKMTTQSHIPEEILQTLIEQCSFFFHSGNEI